MDRTNGAGHVAHRYVAEDIATNRPPTELTPEAMNFLQEELVNLATMLGDALNPASESQVRDVLIKALQQNRFKTAAAAGTADAITAALTPAIPLAALYNGMTLMVRAGAANATTTPTFTPNAGVIPPAQIVKEDNKPLAPGDIAGAGFWMKLAYDSVLDKWALLNPKAASNATRTTISANDYEVLSSGLIIQWGVSAAPSANASVSVTFPLFFPHSCAQVIISDTYGTPTGGSSADQGAQVSAKSQAGFSYFYAWDTATSAVGVPYIAIGF